jgi:hypothetical protein
MRLMLDFVYVDAEKENQTSSSFYKVFCLEDSSIFLASNIDCSVDDAEEEEAIGIII